MGGKPLFAVPFSNMIRKLEILGEFSICLDEAGGLKTCGHDREDSKIFSRTMSRYALSGGGP